MGWLIAVMVLVTVALFARAVKHCPTHGRWQERAGFSLTGEEFCCARGRNEVSHARYLESRKREEAEAFEREVRVHVEALRRIEEQKRLAAGGPMR